MGLFDLFKGKSSQKLQFETAHDGLDVAQDYYNNGDYDMALDIFEAMFDHLIENGPKATIDDHIPYINCLRDAGEKDKAWSTIQQQMSANLSRGEERFRDISRLEGLMEIQLRKEGKFLAAVPHAVVAELCDARFAFELDLGEDESDTQTMFQNIVAAWLGPTDKQERAPQIVELMTTAIEGFPKLDLGGIHRSVQRILQ